MKLPELHIGAGALLLFALLIYFSAPGEAAAVLLPVLAHELGHLAALRLLRLPVRALRFEWTGLRIDCAGGALLWEKLCAALAGPAAGLLYAVGADWIGRRLALEGPRLSAGISLLLTVFNLLPIRPLDGGRVLEALSAAALGEAGGARLCRGVGLLGSGALLGAGLLLWLRGSGPGLALAGAALLAGQFSGGT